MADKEWRDRFLNIKYLMEMHPELTQDEARDLKEFANELTIDLKGCYDKGQIIYPLWKERNKAIKDLLN
jgi:hypothetical protein